jgi:hypothetical protein
VISCWLKTPMPFFSHKLNQSKLREQCSLSVTDTVGAINAHLDCQDKPKNL